MTLSTQLFGHNIWFSNTSLAIQFAHLFPKTKFDLMIALSQIWNNGDIYSHSFKTGKGYCS
jgi:hypothetical protein